MRVLAITDLSGYMTGGPTTAAAGLLAGLAMRGHEVALVNDRLYPGTERLVQHFPAPEPSAGVPPDVVAAALSAMQPDVVHLLAMGQRDLRRLRPVLAGRPWVVTVHSLPPHEKILRRFHGHEPLHYGLRAVRFAPNALGWRVLLTGGGAPHVIVHSEYMRRVLVAMGQSAAAANVIDLAVSLDAQAVDRSPMPPVRGGPDIVTVAGFAHTKGQHDALHAVHLLRKRFPGIRYRMAGEVRDETYLAHLRSLIDRLGLADVATIDVRLPEAAKESRLRAADVYLQPSHEEGFCLAFLEAAWLSPRLVGTATGAIPEICEGDEAMVTVPTRDPHAIAAAITQLVNRAAVDRTALERRHARLKERFSIERYVTAHEALYEKLRARA
jgi:glycosyltransferase involved in cell wall biosynthesis